MRTLLARAPHPERHARVDGRPLDLGDVVPHQTLGTLLTLLQHDDVLERALKIAFPHDWRWLVGQLPSHLEPIVALRNPGAHSERLSRAETAEVRAMVLGIGCEGLMVQVARVRMRAVAQAPAGPIPLWTRVPYYERLREPITGMRNMAKKDVVQVKNPRSGHYVKIDRTEGKILDHKKSEGPYKGVPIARKSAKKK